MFAPGIAQDLTNERAGNDAPEIEHADRREQGLGREKQLEWEVCMASGLSLPGVEGAAALRCGPRETEYRCPRRSRGIREALG
jgi:hypothetical protein